MPSVRKVVVKVSRRALETYSLSEGFSITKVLLPFKMRKSKQAVPQFGMRLIVGTATSIAASPPLN
jgi:hypothetical protein